MPCHHLACSWTTRHFLVALLPDAAAIWEEGGLWRTCEAVMKWHAVLETHQWGHSACSKLAVVPITELICWPVEKNVPIQYW